MAYMDKGLVEEPLLFKFFTSEYAPFGLPPGLEAVRTYAGLLAEIFGGVRYEWFVSCYGKSILDMAAQAAVLGGHVRIGLGDETFADDGRPTNAELVGHVAEMARACGRDVAGPRQAREMMGLPQYEDWVRR